MLTRIILALAVCAAGSALAYFMVQKAWRKK